jgi:hypothetical protein
MGGPRFHVLHNGRVTAGFTISAVGPPRWSCRTQNYRMLGIETTIRGLGGIATMGELLRAGHEAELVHLFAEYGRIIRVRKGWYAAADIDAAVIAACRVGGRLACVSALAFHGLGTPGPARLHVSVPRTASRLRSAGNHRERLAESPHAAIVVHWTRSQPTGDRLAVSVPEALAQAQTCRRR